MTIRLPLVLNAGDTWSLVDPNMKAIVTIKATQSMRINTVQDFVAAVRPYIADWDIEFDHHIRNVKNGCQGLIREQIDW